MATSKPKPSTKEPSAEIVPSIPDDNGEIVPMTPEMLKAWLDGDLLEEDQGDEFDVYALALKILNADSEEAALAQDDVRKHGDLHDQTFTVHSVLWRKSAKQEDGKGRYAITRCTDAAGKSFVWSCGATKVVLQLRKAQLEGWLPWTVTLNAETTASNRTVLELVIPSPDF